MGRDVEGDGEAYKIVNIKNAEVESVASELSRITGSSRTEVIRQALLEKRKR